MNTQNIFFKDPERFSDVDSQAIGTMIAASSDVAIVVNKDGVIHDMSFGAEGVDPEHIKQWVGSRLEDLVTAESRLKISELLADAQAGETPHWREVTHRTANGDDLPVRYSAVRTGTSGQVVLLGRDLRSVARLQNRLVKAQLAMEQDYERFRQLETRYRVLFETSQEALVVIDAESGNIVDVNPRASRILGKSARNLTNSVFEEQFSNTSHRRVVTMLASVRATGQPDTMTVESLDGTAKYDVHCVLFRAATETYVLCRLSRHQAEYNSIMEMDEALETLFKRSSDAIVVTNAVGDIRQCNDAFLALIDVAVAENVRGKSLGQFLGRPGVDLTVMTKNASESGRLSMYSTSLRGTYGTLTPVEISTATLTAKSLDGFGFIIRDVSRLEADRQRSSAVSPEAVEHVMELVGSAPLKELVRSTTDVVEKLCIETALHLTGNNRASAAEMLGLSRQSLYVKLRKFGMINPNDEQV